MNSAPSFCRGLGQAAELQRAGRLRPHGDGKPAVGLGHHRLGDRDPLVEGHGREIARRAAGQQRAIGLDAVVEQEAHIAPRRRQIDREVGIAEHGGHGDVAAFQSLLGAFEFEGGIGGWGALDGSHRLKNIFVRKV